MKKFLLILSLGMSLFASDMIVKNSLCSVNTTVESIESIVQSKGMKVFTVIDHSVGAKSVGMNLNEAKLIIFGNPKLGSALMKQDITTGLDLPIRIFVYKNSEGVVKMAYRDGSWISANHALHATGMLQKMSDTLEYITNRAGQCKKD